MQDAYDTVIADLIQRRVELDTTIKLLRLMKAMGRSLAAIPIPMPAPEPAGQGDGSL